MKRKVSQDELVHSNIRKKLISVAMNESIIAVVCHDRLPWLVQLFYFEVFVNFTMLWAFYQKRWNRTIKQLIGRCSMRKRYSIHFHLCECPFQRLHFVYLKRIRHLNTVLPTMCSLLSWHACSIFPFRFGKSKTL